MRLPLVTIVTPSYNQGRFIRATIESVLTQDYPNIEYIIMDGGSTDETAAVVRDYLGRLTWISERDRGQSHAINKGFQMAKGEIVSWLNSDDLISPGAVRHAVAAFERDPSLGAVYGEGYQIDIAGNVKSRFRATEPFNLWKLIYLSDYILQQTSYFRKDLFERIGYLDESLHWGMDWDLFIRIGKHYPIEYIPEYMGSIREYPAAKSFAGGAKRFRELAEVMRRHGDLRYPPGYVTYGLDTYVPIWSEWMRTRTPRLLNLPLRVAESALSRTAGYTIARTLRMSQGLYADGWVGRKLRYMLGPGSSRVAFSGSVPPFGPLRRQQVLRISCNGIRVGTFRLPAGDFSLTFDVPGGPHQSPPYTFLVEASRTFIPGLAGGSKDFRRLAYMLKSFTWANL